MKEAEEPKFKEKTSAGSEYFLLVEVSSMEASSQVMST